MQKQLCSWRWQPQQSLQTFVTFEHQVEVPRNWKKQTDNGDINTSENGSQSP
eukprot:m.67912 g.67912  ORF g.67912 m.67912 type:complete len:52 (+) comp23884_c1_seq1:167-322(+)